MAKVDKNESISRKLVLSISGILCIVYILVFIAISVVNYALTIRSENKNNYTYLSNTLLTIDDKIKDMSRVSLMSMADEETLRIITDFRDMDTAEQLNSNRYLRSFYSSLSIIRNDICGIYIMDNDDMIFHFDDTESTVRRNILDTPIPEQISALDQEPMLVDNCRIIIDRQPSFMRFTGEFVSNPYYSTCLWMVRDIYSFSPHKRVGEIVVTAPVEKLNDICTGTLSPDNFYLLTTKNGRVICSNDPDDLLINAASLIGSDLPEEGSGSVRYDGKSYYATSHVSEESGLRLIVGRTKSSINKDVFRLVPIYLLFCILTLIAAIVVTAGQVKLIINPVTELAEIMGSFDKNTLSQRLPVVSNDETGKLIEGYNAMLDTIENQIEREYKNLVRLRDAKMREQRMTMLYLKSQVNPHFLYNTLDTIRISAQMNDDPGVAEMLMKLVTFFRLSMRFNQSIVTLEHELDLIENYLALMHFRYTEIESSIDCEPGLEDTELPNFILQPVVENSILHGLRDKGYQGRIDIKVRDAGDDHIEILISDDGIGLTDEAKKRVEKLLYGDNDEKFGNAGIGLQNVQHRLRLFYDESCGLTYIDNPNGGITAKITILKDINKNREGEDIHP